jgi:hypothetical protein
MVDSNVFTTCLSLALFGIGMTAIAGLYFQAAQALIRSTRQEKLKITAEREKMDRRWQVLDKMRRK